METIYFVMSEVRKGSDSKPVYLVTQPIDFRGSSNMLSMYITDCLNKDPRVGVYVFFNHKRNQLKILHWHHNGFSITGKCLESGQFVVIKDTSKGVVPLTLKQLNWLYIGLDWQLMSEVGYPTFK